MRNLTRANCSWRVAAAQEAWRSLPRKSGVSSAAGPVTRFPEANIAFPVSTPTAIIRPITTRLTTSNWLVSMPSGAGIFRRPGCMPAVGRTMPRKPSILLPCWMEPCSGIFIWGTAMATACRIITVWISVRQCISRAAGQIGNLAYRFLIFMIMRMCGTVNTTCLTIRYRPAM